MAYISEEVEAFINPVTRQDEEPLKSRAQLRLEKLKARLERNGADRPTVAVDREWPEVG